MRSDRGAAMPAVILGSAALAFLVIFAFQQATDEFSAAQEQRRDDTLVAGAEAMLERYAAKLTIDPSYFQNWVDEAELPRRCTDTSSTSHGLTRQPGTAWYTDCPTWEYLERDDWYSHPLLDGEDGVAADDVGTRLTVSPPTGSEPLSVTVATRNDGFSHTRAIRADIAPESISEFAFLVQNSLRFGAGAVINGKIYVGNDLDFRPGPPQGIVRKDVFAEDAIGSLSGYGPPIFENGAQGYDGRGNYNDIRAVYPEPLDFSNFWDDLELIRDIACGGAGLCLNRTLNPGLGLSSDPRAWLLEPVVDGGVGRVRISVSYGTNSSRCLTSEEWWWVNSSTESWTVLGTFDLPRVGAIWADNHIIMGRPSAPATIKGGVTIAAGSAGSPKNIVIGTDILYDTGTTGTDVLGLAATDEVIVSPSSVGSDRELNINAAILAQGGTFFVARDCGSSGNVMLPRSSGTPLSTLNTNGGMAIRQTGDVAAHFSPRNYGFDERLERLRPPLFPLLGDGWAYENWQEINLPCWAKGTWDC